MNVAIIGGGPAGLLLAGLLAGEHEVVVHERNPAGATYGFGVAFSDRSLSHLDDADPGLEALIRDASITWNHIDIHHRGRRLRAHGHRLSALPRTRLLEFLQARAAERGADLRFESDVADPAALRRYDLVVGADGVNSRVRAGHEAAIGPAIVPSRAKYIWFGCDAPPGEVADGLTFIFKETEHGRFGIHAYPYGRDARTAIIVEAEEATWRRAGLERAPLPAGESDRASQAYCEALFASELSGRPLLANNSRWLNFQSLRCAAWSDGNVVVIGDAAHTAHFSLGSGTTLAMEDSVALADALARHPGAVPAALAAYERARRPEVERLQDAAAPSVLWWDRFARAMDFGPEQFAFHMLTRTGLMTHERLRRRDPRFTDTIEGWFERAHDGTGLSAPLRAGRLELVNRVVARPQRSNGDAAAYAVCGAALVITRNGGRPLTDGVHAVPGARVALEGEPGAEPADIARRAHADGFDAVALPLDAASAPEQAAAAVAALRAAWPRSVLALVRFEAPVDLDHVSALGAALAHAGCDLAGVIVGERSPLSGMSARMAQTVIADCLRNDGGLATMLVGGFSTDDEARTWVMSSRADACCGEPRLASLGWRAPCGSA